MATTRHRKWFSKRRRRNAQRPRTQRGCELLETRRLLSVNLDWVQQAPINGNNAAINVAGPSGDFGQAIVSDTTGVYNTAYTLRSAPFLPVLSVSKHEPNGNLDWTHAIPSVSALDQILTPRFPNVGDIHEVGYAGKTIAQAEGSIFVASSTGTTTGTNPPDNLPNGYFIEAFTHQGVPTSLNAQPDGSDAVVGQIMINAIEVGRYHNSGFLSQPTVHVFVAGWEFGLGGAKSPYVARHTFQPSLFQPVNGPWVQGSFTLDWQRTFQTMFDAEFTSLDVYYPGNGSTPHVVLTGNTDDPLLAFNNLGTPQGMTDAFAMEIVGTSAPSVPIWTRQWGSPVDDHSWDVAIDAVNPGVPQFYFVGDTNGTVNFPAIPVPPSNPKSGMSDAWILSLLGNGVGSGLVGAQFGSGIGLNDKATGVSLTTPGTLMVTGWTDGDLLGSSSTTGNDIWVGEFDQGNLQLMPGWPIARTIDQNFADDFGGDVAVTGSDIYLTGHTGQQLSTIPGEVPQGDFDAYIAKFGPANLGPYKKCFADPAGLSAYKALIIDGSSAGFSPGDTIDIGRSNTDEVWVRSTTIPFPTSPVASSSVMATVGQIRIVGLSGNETIKIDDAALWIPGTGIPVGTNTSSPIPTDRSIIIYGKSGNDTVNGGQTGECIYGQVGIDTLNGNDGNDWIWGGSDNDTIKGGTGNDRIWGGGGVDVVEGNDGDDHIWGNDGHDTLRGNNDDDVIWGGNGRDTAYGDLGSDEIWGGPDADLRLDGGIGDDWIYGEADHDVIVGGDGSDHIWGGSGIDYIYAGEGDDRVEGGPDNDTIYGDSISTPSAPNWQNHGNDTLFGDAGRDVIYGMWGDDILDGGDDEDRLVGDWHHPHLGQNQPPSPPDFQHGDDCLYGGGGDDRRYSVQNDGFNYGAGLEGSGGNDKLWGGIGDDTLLGESYNYTSSQWPITGDDYFEDNIGNQNGGFISVPANGQNGANTYLTPWSGPPPINATSTPTPVVCQLTPLLRVAPNTPDFEPSMDLNDDSAFDELDLDILAQQVAAGEGDEALLEAWDDILHGVEPVRVLSIQDSGLNFAEMSQVFGSLVDAPESDIITFDGLSGVIAADHFAASHGVTFQNLGEIGAQPEGDPNGVENLDGYDGSYRPDGDIVYLSHPNHGDPFTIVFDEPISAFGAFVATGKEGDIDTLTLNAMDGAGNVLYAEQVTVATNADPQNREGYLAVHFEDLLVTSISIRNNNDTDFGNALIIDDIRWARQSDYQQQFEDAASAHDEYMLNAGPIYVLPPPDPSFIQPDNGGNTIVWAEDGVSIQSVHTGDCDDDGEPEGPGECGITVAPEGGLSGEVDGYDGSYGEDGSPMVVVPIKSDPNDADSDDDGVWIRFAEPVKTVGGVVAVASSCCESWSWGEERWHKTTGVDTDGNVVSQSVTALNLFGDFDNFETFWTLESDQANIASVLLQVVDANDELLPEYTLALDKLTYARPDATPNGDFDNNGALDCDDLRSLHQEILAGTGNGAFDVNGDGLVNLADTNYWIAELYHTIPGDANLDFTVNAADLNQVGLNWRDAGEHLTWCDGDFNGDQVVNAVDLNLVGLNWQASVAPRPAANVARTPQAPLAIGLTAVGLTAVDVARHRPTSTDDAIATSASFNRASEPTSFERDQVNRLLARRSGRLVDRSQWRRSLAGVKPALAGADVELLVLDSAFADLENGYADW